MKRIFSTLAALGLLLLLLCSAPQAAELTRQALHLCAVSVLPALFPLMAASSLLVSLGCASAAGQLLSAVMERLFHCSGSGATALLLGLLGGYPLGARTVAALLHSGEIDRAEAQRLLNFCNNAGPAFIISMVGSLFGSAKTGLTLYLIHVTAALLTGLLLCRKAPKPKRMAVVSPTTETPFSTALVESIGGAGLTCIQLCSFITFFQVVLQLVSKCIHISHPLALGFVELTCGVVRLGTTPGDFIIAAALLGWGGCSVHCQTAAVLADTGLSMSPYLRAKSLHALLSAGLAAAVVFLFP